MIFKASALLLAGATMAMAQHSVLKLSCPSLHGVVLRSSTDARFLSALDPGRDLSADPLIPFSVLIENTTPYDLLGYVIRWNLLNTRGRPITHDIVSYDFDCFKSLTANSGRLVSALGSFNRPDVRSSSNKVQHLIDLYQPTIDR
ncbi:MAG: hypothetical protein M3Y72_14625 [Acidobacteriota bacterium]|nr:hypothetical protein [Acidobacteriota bacterium]